MRGVWNYYNGLRPTVRKQGPIHDFYFILAVSRAGVIEIPMADYSYAPARKIPMGPLGSEPSRVRIRLFFIVIHRKKGPFPP